VLSAGSRIKAARDAAGLSQDALAKALGTSRQRVIGWEIHGQQPGKRNRVKLARLFGGQPEDWHDERPQWNGDLQAERAALDERMTELEERQAEFLTRIERLQAAVERLRPVANGQ
jgi:transcriptional regulator with XRE-family HTH domain